MSARSARPCPRTSSSRRSFCRKAAIFLERRHCEEAKPTKQCRGGRVLIHVLQITLLFGEVGEEGLRRAHAHLALARDDRGECRVDILAHGHAAADEDMRAI